MFNAADTADYNPLLDIDTSFAAYLKARTRSYKDHMVGGMLDYAFDADFSVKQKITSFSAWSKIYKSLINNEIPDKIKKLFQTSDAASSMKHPDIYNIVQVCAEKLQISVPTVYVRNAPDKFEVYSVAAEGTDPCIVITTGIIESCSKEELRFLIGCECGHIQNNHCSFIMAASYFGLTSSEDVDNYFAAAGDGSAKQTARTISEWIRLADVTGDRAGMICLSDPQTYPTIMNNLHSKGVFSSYGNKLDLNELLKQYEVLHITPARNIVMPKDCTALDRRILAGLEFLSCEALYNWRPDLNKSDVHTVNKQALEVRCEIILDAAKGGV